MRILFVYGTRPEWLKIKPVVEKLKESSIEFEVAQIGQHTDLIKGMPYDFRIKLNSMGCQSCNRLNSLFSIITKKMTETFCFNGDEKWSHVFVQGDTTTGAAVALSAFHHGINIIHLEAGLRTYDMKSPYPEEFNRQLISKIADIHLCPTDFSKHNLLNESVWGDIHVVGNTVLDNLVDIKTSYCGKVVITMHRRENHKNIREWFEQFEKLANLNKDLEFVFVAHPNPKVQENLDVFELVQVIDSLPYDEFIELLALSKFVISDSGGLQEETAFFGKICFVCRDKTERIEGVRSGHHIMVHKPSDFDKVAEWITSADSWSDGYWSRTDCPYGDGKSAEKIVEILENIK